MKKLLIYLLMPFVVCGTDPTENAQKAIDSIIALEVGFSSRRSRSRSPIRAIPDPQTIIFNTNETHCHSHGETSEPEDTTTPGRTWCSQRTQVVVSLGVITAFTTILSAMIAASVTLIIHFSK